MWQDYVFAIGGIFFIIALIPSFASKNKPSMYTSFINSLVLSAFGYAQFSLDLNFAGVVSLVTAIAWYALGVQKAWEKF